MGSVVHLQHGLWLVFTGGTEIFSGIRAPASFCLFVSERDLCREGSQWLRVCVLCGVLPISAESSVLELTACVSIWVSKRLFLC